MAIAINQMWKDDVMVGRSGGDGVEMEMQRKRWECILDVFKFYSRSCEGCETTQELQDCAMPSLKG